MIAAAKAAATHQSQSNDPAISTGPFSGLISASSILVLLVCEGNTRALFVLAMPQTFFASFEKSRERSRVGFARAELDRVDAGGGEKLF